MLARTVLMALARVEILETFSLGRLLAGVVVMTAARRGVGEGVMAGACAGVALDLSSAQAPYDSMIFTLAGLVCGLCRERGKILAALAYVAAGSVAVLWTWEGGVRWGMPLEAAVGACIFLALPLSKKRDTVGTPEKEPSARLGHGAELQGALGKLEDLAGAFHDLAGSVTGTLRPEPPAGENPGEIFTRAADKVCARCVLGNTCWQKESTATKDAMNNATPSALERGRALATDFPGQFSHRCVHFPEFLGEVNRQLTAFLRRRQSRKRTEETKQVLLSHYSRLDALLSQAAAELSASLTPDLPRQTKLEAYLRSMAQKGGAVYYDAKGHLRVETPVTPQLKTAAVRRELGQVLGTPLREGEEKGGRLVFTQAEPFRVTAAVAGAPKKGEGVSGDTGTWFRREDGVLFLLLCDGMGSGPGAKEESARAAGLIEDFLRAGLAEEETLEAVASALALRGEPFGCATVDLMAIDLFTGRCKLYKQGAAPTYLRRKDRVEKAAARSLPAGTATGKGAKPHCREFRGQAGDWLVLVTDGILCGREDTWLRERMESYHGTSPGELAQIILRQSQDLHGGEDDSTVIAVRLEQSRELTREPPKDRAREQAALR
jgi:stage II sporulation protein E